MFRRFGVRIALTLMLVLGVGNSALSQCKNQVSLVPLTPFKAASKPHDFARFRYALSDSDSLVVRSHEDPSTTLGPFDEGFVILRGNKVLRRLSLSALPEMRHKDSDFAESFNTLTVTRACGSEAPIFFVTMQYSGDETSPALLFTIVPSADGYDVSTLPMISGGALEVSRANPSHIRTWDNLHENMCEACETPYEVTEYEIRDGKPVRTKKYRTRHLYQSANFDDRRRIRFIP